MNRTQTHVEHLWHHKGKRVRLDQCLKIKFNDISRAYLQSLIQNQTVTINGAACRKGSWVSEGDQIAIEPFIHPDDRTIVAPDSPSLTIVKEAQDYILIDKPAGIPTHVNAFDDTHAISNHFMGLYPDAKEVGDDPLRPGVVHRLDTDTSGLLILAKTQKGYDAFRALFDQRRIQKIYMALVLGKVLDASLTIKTPVAHHPKNPRKMIVVPHDGISYRSRLRQAATQIQVHSYYEDRTLLSVKTLTGRMHQVRVHMASIGHPLVGDKLYQNAKEKHLDQHDLHRHFLHACELKFTDPFTGETIETLSTLPDELKSCINTLNAT